MVMLLVCSQLWFFFVKQKTAYEMRISDWSSDVCSSDLTSLDTSGNLGASQPPLAAIPAHRFGERLVGIALGAPQLGGGAFAFQMGRASCRERVCQYV